MSVKQLGRYELLEQLGEGGMGAVWLARLSGSHGFEKMCIVKTVLPAIAKDADFVSRFLHEGRVLTQLVHGNIAQVLDMNEADGQLFLALEYVAGVDLSRLHENVRAANEYMPTALVVALIAQAAEGLGAAHRKQALDGSPLHVVHRDVSPQNIMVSYEGEVKVIDFGIAKSEARSKHTAQASVMGKLGYMAPEQARGENVDHRADQYALAIVLWELLANQPFVRRGTLTEMVVAMAAPTLKPLSGLRADVPPSLEAVVLKALAPDPNARYPDTDSFARALTAELLALGPPPTKPQLGEYVKHRCATEFNAQRQLLTRVSTLRSGITPRPLPSDPLDATSLRPGPPVATTEHEPLASTQQLPPRPDTSQLTVPGRPSAVANPGVVTRESKLPHVAPAAPSQDLGAPPQESAPSSSTVPPAPQATGVPSPAAAAGGIAAPLTTGELAAVTPARSRTPLLIVGGLGVVAILALVVLWPGKAPTTTPAVDAGLAVAPVVVPDASAAPGETRDAAVVVAPPPVVEEPDAGLAVVEPQPTLRLTARNTGTSWILGNLNRTTWTECSLTVPGRRRGKVGKISAGSSVEVAAASLRVDPLAPLLVGQLRVDCAQGFGFAKAR